MGKILSLYRKESVKHQCQGQKKTKISRIQNRRRYRQYRLQSPVAAHSEALGAASALQALSSAEDLERLMFQGMIPTCVFQRKNNLLASGG